VKPLQINYILFFPFRHPALLWLAVCFSFILYLGNSPASIYDIQDPYWVIPIATLILLSPLWHGLFILLMNGYYRKSPISITEALSQAIPLYTRLFVGEILVNLLVIGGAMLFFVPGVYFGLRSSFYKQAISIDGSTALAGIRDSFTRTPGWRVPGMLLLLLSPFYALAFLFSYLISIITSGIVGEVLVVLVSALIFVWTNTLLTAIYLNQKTHQLSDAEESTIGNISAP